MFCSLNMQLCDALVEFAIAATYNVLLFACVSSDYGGKGAVEWVKVKPSPAVSKIRFKTQKYNGGNFTCSLGVLYIISLVHFSTPV